jgi:hypothetical protein
MATRRIQTLVIMCFFMDLSSIWGGAASLFPPCRHSETPKQRTKGIKETGGASGPPAPARPRDAYRQIEDSFVCIDTGAENRYNC